MWAFYFGEHPKSQWKKLEQEGSGPGKRNGHFMERRGRETGHPNQDCRKRGAKEAAT